MSYNDQTPPRVYLDSRTHGWVEFIVKSGKNLELRWYKSGLLTIHNMLTMFSEKSLTVPMSLNT